MVTIISYTDKIVRLKAKIDNDDLISASNKELLNKFLVVYDVSEARKSIFLERIHIFLAQFPDITKVKRDQINKWFAKLKKQYAPATIATYVGVICRFARWLHDGTLPTAYMDMKIKSGKKTLRNLQPEQMITWEDGINMARLAPSPQIQAILTMQLDGGFRPGEFTSLNVGDISITNGLCVCHVRHGKTGARHVVLYRSTPYLTAWLSQHPTRNPSDPLWIDEQTFFKKGKAVRYKYHAFSKRLRTLGKRAGVNKPLDFYNFRHSSCTLDKKDNLPADLAAERHGHSIKFYTDVYGRLNADDTVHRIQQYFGMGAQTPVNPMQKYAIQPGIIKPTADQGEAFAQQQMMEQRIQQMQAQLNTMRQQHPTNPTPNMYSEHTAQYPPCGIPQPMQSYKSSHQ